MAKLWEAMSQEAFFTIDSDAPQLDLNVVLPVGLVGRGRKPREELFDLEGLRGRLGPVRD